MRETLYYRDDAANSDKTYAVELKNQGSGYVVNFEYGRRTGAKTQGTKTPRPVSLTEAENIYQKLLHSKRAKGYSSGPDSRKYQDNVDKKASGFNVQLLNEITSEHMERLIKDPMFWLQEKKDGRRMMLRKKGSTIIGINRRGLTIPVPQMMAEDLLRYRGDFIIDGELVGNDLYVFDVLTIGEKDMRDEPYEKRYNSLDQLCAALSHPDIHLVDAFESSDEKRDALNTFRLDLAEGVVFKDIRAKYVAGRPSKGGTQLKFKFWESASCIVTKVNAKRSVGLGVWDSKGNLIDVGNCTIPPNQSIPPENSVVEIKYLYAYEGGSLFEPSYLGSRDDITSDECSVDQLKYKQETVEK